VAADSVAYIDVAFPITVACPRLANAIHDEELDVESWMADLEKEQRVLPTRVAASLKALLGHKNYKRVNRYLLTRPRKIYQQVFAAVRSLPHCFDPLGR